MKTSLLIPVFNHANHLPPLLRALRSAKAEIIFIDQGSTDESLSLLENANVIREPRHGLAEALNRGISAASGELLLFLAADAVPAPQWVKAMEKALGEADLVVGQTTSRAEKKPSAYGKLAAKLFSGHSERTARAHGHALPWGPVANLGARRTLLEKTGPFSPDSASAFDIDWCWRAMLQGARIAYAKDARVEQARSQKREHLLEEFERFGFGEAWLHRTYAFLLSPEDQKPDPLLASVDAFNRLLHRSQAANSKALRPTLEEVSVAFANGVRLGYERAHRECPLERSAPKSAIAWASGAKELTVFVPGKGLATLKGKELQLWEAMRAGANASELIQLFMRLFKADFPTAQHEVAHFRENFQP